MSQSDSQTDIPLAEIAVEKYLDPDGDVYLRIRASDDLPLWEAYGMLTAACDIQREAMHDSFRTDEDDGE
jgi:hypothetical protein